LLLRDTCIIDLYISVTSPRRETANKLHIDTEKEKKREKEIEKLLILATDFKIS